MSSKKMLKAQKPTDKDKEVKAKRTGYRFKTEGVKALHKKDGSLNKKGESLYFKKPSATEIEKYKKNPDGSYDDKTKQIYHERRADRKHSDDNLTKKFGGGGAVKQNPAQSESYSKSKDKLEKAKPVGMRFTDKLAKKLHKSPNATPTKKEVEKFIGKGVYDEKRKDKSDVSLKKKFKGGGSVKQNPAQSESYSKSKDKLEKAKPVGMRYTNELADELGKSHNATPTKKDVEEYLGNGVYDEKRKDKSDVSLAKKFEGGGEAEEEVRMSVEEMTALLGRAPKYPRDYINGKKYEKCFLIPFYRLKD